MMCSAEFAVTN